MSGVQETRVSRSHAHAAAAARAAQEAARDDRIADLASRANWWLNVTFSLVAACWLAALVLGLGLFVRWSLG